MEAEVRSRELLEGNASAFDSRHLLQLWHPCGRGTLLWLVIGHAVLEPRLASLSGICFDMRLVNSDAAKQWRCLPAVTSGDDEEDLHELELLLQFVEAQVSKNEDFEFMQAFFRSAPVTSTCSSSSAALEAHASSPDQVV